ncbi:MAG: pilus assembly protein PilM, partial [Patescibacteria group bacterium]|nr:pilus assembly protein PilM [Patescibacteria group bacterium]
SSAVSIPLGASLLSIMEMPIMDSKQLAKMIPIEARKYIPVPISEVVLDWWVVPKHYDSVDDSSADGSVKEDERKKRVDVLVVAIHNETVDKYRSIIQESGLKNNFLELEVFSMARATFGNNTAPVMLLDFGAGTTKLAIVEYGIIRNQHIINRGSQDITISISKSLGVSIEKAEHLKRDIGLTGTGADADISKAASLTLEHIFSETNRVLLNYQRRYNKTIKNVVLTGGGALLKGLHDFAGSNLETEVLFADPFSKVEAPAFLEPLLKDAGPEFAVAIGLALRKLQELG